MKILLVRHGETDFNKNKRIQGHTDIPLNETGENQAINAGSKISKYDVDAAFSSPLKRAIQTARLMLDNSKNNSNKELEIITDDRLIEKYFGDFEGSTFEEYFSALESGEGLETVELEERVYKRASEFFINQYDEYKGKTICVVCHGALIRIFLRTLGLYPHNEMINNTSLNVVNFNGEEFTLEEFNI